MIEVTVRLTKAEQEFVERHMSVLGTSSVSKYFSGLLEAERKRQAREKFLAFIRAGDESGSDGPMTDADWAQVHHEIAEYDQQLRGQSHGPGTAKPRRAARPA